MDQEPSFTRRLREVERELRGQVQETAVTLENHGREVAREVGGRAHVFINSRTARGRIVVHNHPVDESFSRADVKALIETGAREFRVVTDSATYTLQVPASERWTPHLEREVTELYLEWMETLAVDVREGRISVEAASREVLHRLWEHVARVRGWAYGRELVEQ